MASISPRQSYIKTGATLQLSCTVDLGPAGPDTDFRAKAVVHWFHGQRLLDPAIDQWRNHGPDKGRRRGQGKPSRISIRSEVKNDLRGWLQISQVTPYDAGNYTCVPSYARPASAQVYVLHGAKERDFLLVDTVNEKQFFFSFLSEAENQASLHKEVSEVRAEVSSAASPCVLLLSQYHVLVMLPLLKKHR